MKESLFDSFDEDMIDDDAVATVWHEMLTDSRGHVRPSRRVRWSDSAFALALGVAVFGAIWSFAAADRDPQSSREGTFLAVWTAAVVAFAAVWGGRRARWTALTGAVAATIATWAVGTGYLRGALLGAILTSVVAAVVWWMRDRDELWLALCCGSQLLIRSDLALGNFDSRGLVEIFVHWLGLPLVAGLCLQILARRYGISRTASAALAGLILGPGWTLTVVGSVVSVTGGLLLTSSGLRHRWLGAAMLAMVALGGPGAGASLLLAGLVVAIEGSGRWLPIAGLIAILLSSLGVADPNRALADVLLTAALAPSMMLAPLPVAGLAALLIATAAIVGSGSGLLAVGAIVGVLHGPGKGSASWLQCWWVAGLAVWVSLAAAYPWLRTDPLRDAVGIVGGSGWLGPAKVVLFAATMIGGGAWLLDRFAADWKRVRSTILLLAASLLVVVLVSHPVEVVERPLEERPAQVNFLEPRHFRHEMVSTEALRMVVIDASLTNSVALPAGSAVARLRLLGPDQRELAGTDLRVGIEIADWAIERGAEGKLGHWMAFVPPSKAPIFGYRYRVRVDLPAALQVAAVELVALPGLGTEARLVVYRMELRR